MKTISWFFLGGLALAVALLLGWQRLQMRPLQAEIEVLRDQQGEIARLRAERERLLARQVPEAELQRLREDREAIGRLRKAIGEVRARAELKSAAVSAKEPERFAPGAEMPAAAWRNAGAATPAAALETVLWAAAGGDVETFARRIRFDAGAREAAQQLLRSLPPAEQARHASPEHLLAYLSIKDVPTGSATILEELRGTETQKSIRVGFTDAQQKLKPSAYLLFVREGEEWKMRANEATVARYAAALRGAPVAAGGK